MKKSILRTNLHSAGSVRHAEAKYPRSPDEGSVIARVAVQDGASIDI
jgi:hypothetical protein